MTIAFIGTVHFSLAALERLIFLNMRPIIVITRKEPGPHADFANLVPICKRYEIECLQTNDVNSPVTIDRLKEKAPDYIFCFGWSQLLKEDLLAVPTNGTVGFHPALLPKNRGRHPIIWALALGLQETGSTFFLIDKGVDSGSIISQKQISIYYEDNAQSLYEKITHTALNQIEDFLPQLQSGKVESLKQDDTISNHWRKRNKDDGLIDWRMGSLSIYNLVRALAKPYPGAHFNFDGKEIKVWKVKEVKVDGSCNIEPGKILEVMPDKSFVVKTGENAVHVIDYEPKDIVLKQNEYIR